MEYLPEFKSVQTGKSAVDDKTTAAFPYGPLGRGVCRYAAFYCLSVTVLTSVIWFVARDLTAAVWCALGVSLILTAAAVLLLGNRKFWPKHDDVGDRLTPEEALVAYDLLSTLIDSMPANFLVKDKEHRYILVNKTMGDWFGWDPADVLGKRFDEISWNRDYSAEFPKIEEEDERVLKTGESTERFFEIEGPYGNWIKLLSRRFAIRSAEGEIVGIAVINVDMTELEATRDEFEALRRERDRQAFIFKNFFEALPFPAAMKDMDGRFLSVNSQLYKWPPFSGTNIIGRRLDEVMEYEAAKDSIELDAQVLRTREPGEIERDVPYVGETTRSVRILRFPILDDDGELFGLGLFNIDVTDQRAAERLLKDTNVELERLVSDRTSELENANAELTRTLDELKATTDLLIESDRMASLGSMVAGMAHEINTPIGVGVTAASLVRDKVDQLQKDFGAGTLTRDGMTESMSVIDEASDVMLRNMARADGLIRSLKQVAVDQTNLETRDVQLEHYIRDVELSVAPVLRKSGISIEIDCRADLTLCLQPGPLAQVMTNILMNCVHHAYPEGEGGRIKITTVLSDDGVEIRFRDFGVGMDQETAGQAFVPFFTTRRNKGGTGLGLSIVYNVVRSVLGGDIACESVKGKGTLFIVTLPANCVVNQTA
ncbi:PAS domain S-box protein [Hwanghaeella grinnelliae]|uniref:histidine kinase n=1 Tax=Hwanghaeella grinnelliae TaxID=2500179 RepID=A0A3S2VP61_9PROT|nr:PAS domain-containing protein [Hwanghaeella grinnelliae]RVU38332.1 PAS domain S-box protein [Hwanghaeella grinnelliae]